MNTSSNQIVRRFVDIADRTTRCDIERLIAGEGICKELVENLTYGELDENSEYLWSVLYLTGYLTLAPCDQQPGDGRTCLVIPNKEVREIFIDEIRKWFADKVEGEKDSLAELYHTLKNGDAKGAEAFLNRQLRATISYYDSYEGFYHGFLLGLLKGRIDWMVLSNREAGVGRSDIQIECEDGKTGIIIETKRGKNRKELPALCDMALNQIEEKGYAEPLYDDGISEIWAYGVSFYKKTCCIRVARMMEMN